MVELMTKATYTIAVYRSRFEGLAGGTFIHYATHFENAGNRIILEFGCYDMTDGKLRIRQEGMYQDEVLVTAWEMDAGDFPMHTVIDEMLADAALAGGQWTPFTHSCYTAAMRVAINHAPTNSWLPIYQEILPLFEDFMSDLSDLVVTTFHQLLQ